MSSIPCPFSWLWVAASMSGCLFFYFPFPLNASESKTLKDRFSLEAPTAWEEYRNFADRLQGTVDATWTVKDTILRKFHLEFKSNSTCKLVLHESPTKDLLSGDAHAFNPRYAFGLKRKTNDEPWVLANLQIGRFRGSQERWEDFTFLHSCISGHLYELPELVRLPNFRVRQASLMQRDGTEICQIEFDSKQTEGVVQLDPNRSWTILHSTIRERYPDEVIVVKEDIEVCAPLGKYPLPKRVVIEKEWIGSKNNKPPAHGVVDFNLRQVSTPPDEREFTLSAFGLPEPMGVSPLPQSRTWLWILAASVTAALIAMLFAWLKRRRAMTDQASISTASPRRGS